MKALWAFLVIAVLTGCDNGKTEKRAERLAKEQKEFTEKMATISSPREYQVNGHQLLVVKIPVDSFGVDVDYQRCFIWRDQEFKTATMQCEQPPEMDLTAPE